MSKVVEHPSAAVLRLQHENETLREAVLSLVAAIEDAHRPRAHGWTEVERQLERALARARRLTR